ncbi:hypothetical protein KR084_012907 [Drosophila pseudotakahashii]|nr:hypothetical protein KR084_012907 [Drosophila pseudotakahashii]
MLRLAFFFTCTLIILDLRGSSAHSQDNGGTVCTLHDAPSQCGAFCLSALRPLFDHNHKMRRRLAVIEENGKRAVTKEDFDARLDEVRDQLRAGLTEVQTKMQNYQELQTLKTEVQKILERQSGDFPKPLLETLERVAFNIPPEFEKIGNRYFYIENNNKLNWTEAGTKCHQMGGYLAAIQNPDELNALTAKLEKNTDYWLGINDIKEEGQFVSSASRKPAPYLNWSQGEPNNVQEGEDCVLLFNGVMNDANALREHYFICQSDDKI